MSRVLRRILCPLILLSLCGCASQELTAASSEEASSADEVLQSDDAKPVERNSKLTTPRPSGQPAGKLKRLTNRKSQETNKLSPGASKLTPEDNRLGLYFYFLSEDGVALSLSKWFQTQVGKLNPCFRLLPKDRQEIVGHGEIQLRPKTAEVTWSWQELTPEHPQFRRCWNQKMKTAIKSPAKSHTTGKLFFTTFNGTPPSTPIPGTTHYIPPTPQPKILQ